MHYCIQNIYHMYYTTPWNFIILRKFSHMTLTSPNEKWMRVADIVRRFCHFLLWTVIQNPEAHRPKWKHKHINTWCLMHTQHTKGNKWRREFCFDVVGNFEPKKITPNCNALAKSIISYLWVSYYTFVFSWQCKTTLFTNKKTCSDIIGACASHYVT